MAATNEHDITIDGRSSVGSNVVQPFRVPLKFIDKNTIIDATFARNNYHYYHFFDPSKQQQLRHNLFHPHLHPMDNSDEHITDVINIYHNVVNNIKQNCRIHLHSMICQRCKDINWVLESGQEPRSMDDVWRILSTKQSMIDEDGGVQYFSYTYYIIRTLSYCMNNSWLQKGIDDSVSNYYIELEESCDKHIRHGFLKIGSLVIDSLKKRLHDFELSLFKCTFLERKHNSSDRQYLDRFHWTDIQLDQHIIHSTKPVKGFIKSRFQPSQNVMISYHLCQLVNTAHNTNVTKSELIKMVEDKFDGN